MLRFATFRRDSTIEFARPLILATLLGGATIALALRPRIAQDLRYHAMADARTIAGVANFANVVSNVPFLLVGLFGLSVVARRSSPFETRREMWPYATFFFGALLTAFGSAWYHLAPGNGTLVWDRLPMTFAFMGLLTGIVADRAGTAAARWLFGPLIVLGVFSVVQWHWSEVRGAGDLRLYALVQFGSLAAIVLLLILYPSRYRRSTAHVVIGLLLYGIAKVFEVLDQEFLEMTGIISGHTLKHLASAAAIGAIAVMLHRRRRTFPST